MNEIRSGKYRVEYLPVARDDLLEIFDYIRKDNPGAAGGFIEKIDEAISKLEDFPGLGAVPKDNRLRLLGYRMLIIDNYIAFYVVKKDVVEIRRIVHGRRRYSFLVE